MRARLATAAVARPWTMTDGRGWGARRVHRPIKVLRDVSTSSFKVRLSRRRSVTIPETWADYVGWRVPVTAHVLFAYTSRVPRLLTHLCPSYAATMMRLLVNDESCPP